MLLAWGTAEVPTVPAGEQGQELLEGRVEFSPSDNQWLPSIREQEQKSSLAPPWLSWSRKTPNPGRYCSLTSPAFEQGYEQSLPLGQQGGAEQGLLLDSCLNPGTMAMATWKIWAYLLFSSCQW